MGRSKELFLYAEEDAWRASPEYQAMLEEWRREEAAAAAEQDRRELVSADEDQGFALDWSAAPSNSSVLKADEVADRLRCHLSTVYELLRAGKLKGFSLTGNTDPNKRGRKGLRILASSVDALIAGGVAEYQVAKVRPGPTPAVVPVASALPRPPLREATTARRTGSRVILPPPR